MKVGREEMIGMLAAVESWVRRDHAAEWASWVKRCEHIAARVSTLKGVSAIVTREPHASLSNRSPRLTIRWTAADLGITGQSVAELLDKGEPRIALAGAGGGGGPAQELPGDTGIAITSAMMSPGDETIVADRVLAVLSARHTLAPVAPPAAAAADLSGRWDVVITYAASEATHVLQLRQDGNRVEGSHQGNFETRDIAGTVTGTAMALASTVTERHGDSLIYRFSGTVSGDTLSGTLDMGEYLTATWTARRPSRA
jgi:L-seryl-tRNA(Ser) seleniumtransferase